MSTSTASASSNRMSRVMAASNGTAAVDAVQVSPMGEPSRFQRGCVLGRRPGAPLSRQYAGGWEGDLGRRARVQRAFDAKTRAVGLRRRLGRRQAEAGGNSGACGIDQGLPSNCAAMASISTLNSGRVKPETIIRVEAGGGSADRKS